MYVKGELVYYQDWKIVWSSVLFCYYPYLEQIWRRYTVTEMLLTCRTLHIPAKINVRLRPQSPSLLKRRNEIGPFNLFLKTFSMFPCYIISVFYIVKHIAYTCFVNLFCIKDDLQYDDLINIVCGREARCIPKSWPSLIILSMFCRLTYNYVVYSVFLS